VLAKKFARILPHLDERQQRLYLASEAEARGYGGIALVAAASGVGRPTLHKGLKELAQGPPADDRVRRAGGGRKKLADSNPMLVVALKALVDPETRGDPMSPLKWVSKSTRQIAEALGQQGFIVTHTLVARMLHELGFSLQANRKTEEGGDHPDRDKQFKYINKQVRVHLKAGQPVVSVDCKKKELVGNYKNAGQEWLPAGQPENVKVYDFVDPELGKALPYGIYDVGRNEGLVNVGMDHDTAAFAVESLRRWWSTVGLCAYPDADRLLICADGGGSNGSRVRLWKHQLAELARETGLTITVCHLPPGTSKWNKIEHRMFSHISMNWRGRPLVTHDVVVQLIAATTTRQGLRIQATLDQGEYPTQVKVTDQEMKALPLVPHTFHGNWNYTLTPAKSRK